MLRRSMLLVAWLAASLLSSHAQQPSPLLTQPEAKLIAVLQSPDATLKAKADACRELGVVGTPRAVAALAALLPDEQLNHMARYALEPIPDPSVDAALRAALTRATGRPLVGVIVSLGVRRNTAAVPLLAARLQDADADVAQAAARALGRIGNPAAARAIQSNLTGAPAANRVAFCEGLFRCAEQLERDGRRREAIAIYDRLMAFDAAPHQVRAGAWRGAILARGQSGLSLLTRGLTGTDYIAAAAAARAALELPGREVTVALARVLPSLTGDRKVLVIGVLGKRGEPSALSTLVKEARAGETATRVAAVRAIPELRLPASVAPLMELMNDPVREVAKAAQESLAGLPGPAADKAITGLLASAKASDRVTAIELIGRRRMIECVPALVKAGSDPDASVRPAALKRAGELGSVAELPALLDLLARAGSDADRDAAEEAISSIIGNAADPAASVPTVVGKLAGASPATTSSLLRVLTSVGGPEALKAVRARVDSSEPAVRATAIRSLSAWKSADVAPELLALAGKASSPADKAVLLRGYFGWASNPDLPAERRLAMCQAAAAVVGQPEEKKLMLGALGSIKTVEALGVAAACLEDGAVKDEAGVAVVAIAEELLKGGQAAQLAPKLIAPLQQVGRSVGNADLAQKAKNLADQAQRK